MILKGQPISFDKKLMPPYIIKFNIAMLIFFGAWFVVCVPAMTAVGFIFEESAEFYITFGVSMGGFFVGLGIFYIVALRLRERLVDERTADLEREFKDMPLDEATEILKQRGVINDTGFIVGDEPFDEKCVPFDAGEISVSPVFRIAYGFGHSRKYKVNALKIEMHVDIYVRLDSGCPLVVYPIGLLDCALFNFLDKKNLVVYEYNRDFCYLKGDKKNLVRNILGFRLK